jgi:hypothetical protein
MDYRKVLETFVENDDVLGLLLDFISNKQRQADASVLATLPDSGS